MERGGTGEHFPQRAPVEVHEPASAPGRRLPWLPIGIGAVLAVGIGLVAGAGRGDDEPEDPAPTVDDVPQAEPLRDFQVFQIAEPPRPVLSPAVLSLDTGLGRDAGGAAVDAGATVVPAERAPAVPVELPAENQFDDLTLERLRSVRVEQRPEDVVITGPEGELPEHWQDADLFYDPSDFGIYVDEHEGVDRDETFDHDQSHSDDYE